MAERSFARRHRSTSQTTALRSYVSRGVGAGGFRLAEIHLDRDRTDELFIKSLKV